MRDIPFIDAHVHLWRLDRLRYPWLTPPFTDDGPNGSVEPIARDYLPADYRAEAANWNLAGYVHVEAGAHPADAVAETRWLDLLEGGPDALVAFAALDDPDLGSLLDAHARSGKLRGVRHIVNWHVDPRRTYTPRDVTGDENWQRGFALLARRGLSFDLQCYPGQMPGLARLIERHPDVPVVIDHLGMPLPGKGERAEWRAGLAALAALPNTAIKISGFGFHKRAWTAVDARPPILAAIDLFGPNRVMAASDFPTDRLFGSFDHTLSAYAEAIQDLTTVERSAVWGGNARTFYHLY